MAPGDVAELLPHVRQADLMESDAMFGPGSMVWTLPRSVATSYLCWSARFRGEIGCIFGVAPINAVAGIGAPWLIGTPLIDRYRGVFMRACPGYVAQMQELFPTLFNVIDSRNVKSMAWLKRLGFTIHPPQPMGRAGEAFYPFTREG